MTNFKEVMKHFIVAIFLLSCFTSKSQTLNQIPGYGNKWLRGAFDSVLSVPEGLGPLRLPVTDSNRRQLRYNPADQSLYIRTHVGTWRKVGDTSLANYQAALDLKQDKLTPGSTTQYYDGTLALRSFQTSVYTSGDLRYALQAHQHEATDIVDFTQAVRNLFSAGSGLTYNSATGVFAFDGIPGSGTVTNITADYPISIINPSTTPHFKLDTLAGKWRTENYYKTIFQPIGNYGSAVDTMYAHTDSTLRVHTFDGKLWDIPFETVPISPGGSGGGISEVIAAWGLANVNDSTLKADSNVLKNVFYNKNSVDSGLALKLNKSDTAAMLAPYIRTNVAVDSFRSIRSSIPVDDPADFADVVDSTGQPGKRVLFAGANQKIRSDQYFLWDSVNHKLMINHNQISAGRAGAKLVVKGLLDVNGAVWGTSINMAGGTAAQFLMANGTVRDTTQHHSTGWNNVNYYPYSGNPAGYLTSYTETDPIAKAVNGILKSNGTTLSAAVAGTDYEAALGNPSVNGQVLASTTGGVRSWVTMTSGSTYTGTTNRISLTGSAFDIDAAYVGQTSITTLGTIGTGTWNATAISTSKGGAPSGGSTGQVLLKNSATNYDYSWGTNSATVAIGSAITSATAGSVFFAGTSGVLAQDNSNLFWDNANKRIGIGTSSPVYLFDAQKSTDAIISTQSTGSTTYGLLRAANDLGYFGSLTTWGSAHATGSGTLLNNTSLGASNNLILISDATVTSGGLHHISLRPGGLNTTDVLTVFSNANVSIGTGDSTTAKLNVNGTLNASGAVTMSNALNVAGLVTGAAYGTVPGSTASGGNLTLTSTSHGTKGKIYLGSSLNSYYDQSTDQIYMSAYNTSSYRLRLGSLAFQPYALNNAWFGDNVDFNGTAFALRATGYGELFYFFDGEGQFRLANTAAAGNTTSSINNYSQMKTNYDGSFATGFQMSKLPGNYTGAQFMVKGSTGNVLINTTTDNSKLTVNGSFATAYVAKTTAYTATISDYTINNDATSAAYQVTLPTAVGITGRIYTLRKSDVSANAVTVGTTSSQTINGSTTYSLATQYKYVQVQSDGANWMVIANN